MDVARSFGNVWPQTALTILREGVEIKHSWGTLRMWFVLEILQRFFLFFSFYIRVHN